MGLEVVEERLRKRGGGGGRRGAWERRVCQGEKGGGDVNGTHA